MKAIRLELWLIFLIKVHWKIEQGMDGLPQSTLLAVDRFK